MSKKMNTWQGLIDAFGGPTAFAEAIDIQVGAAKMMRQRNSVHSDHWPMIVARAPAAGLCGVTMEFLASLRKGNKPAGQRGARFHESRVA